MPARVTLRPPNATYVRAQMIKPGRLPATSAPLPTRPGPALPTTTPARPIATPRAAARPAMSAAVRPSTPPLQPVAVVKKAGFSSWLGAHKVLASIMVVLLVTATVVVASVLINQTVSTAPTTKAPDVTFLSGDDLAAIEALGFLDVSIGTSATSASMSILGIAGATDVTMTDALELNNGHATQDYTVTLVRSAALDADINLFTITLRGVSGGDVTWDVKGDADGRSPSFTLQDDGTAGDQLEIDFQLGIVDGVANGADLDDFDLTFELVPV